MTAPERDQERDLEAGLARLATGAVPDATPVPPPPWRDGVRPSTARRFGRATPWLVAAVLLVLAGLGVGAVATFDADRPDLAPVGSQPPAPATTSPTADPAPTTTTPPPAATTVPAGPGPTGGAVATPTGTAPGTAAGPGLCTPTVARFSVDDASGGANHFGVLVHVVNASSLPCVTTGYPGVALLDGNGQQVEQAQRTPSGYLGGLASGASASRIVLAPGDEATALIEGLNGNATGPACASSPALLFTLPDNTDATTLRHTTQVCDDLQVHPFIVGDTGGSVS